MDIGIWGGVALDRAVHVCLCIRRRLRPEILSEELCRRVAFELGFHSRSCWELHLGENT